MFLLYNQRDVTMLVTRFEHISRFKQNLWKDIERVAKIVDGKVPEIAMELKMNAVALVAEVGLEEREIDALGGLCW